MKEKKIFRKNYNRFENEIIWNLEVWENNLVDSGALVVWDKGFEEYFNDLYSYTDLQKVLNMAK